MNVLALVTDAFGGFGGIARYNRDFLTALAQCSGGSRIIIVPRLCDAGRIVLPPGVQQLKPKGGKLAYTFAAFRAAMTRGRYDLEFCGHLHMAPLGVIIARLLG